MDTRRRPAAEAAIWRSVAYPTGADVVDLVFNPIRPVLLVCPSSVMVVRIVGWESVVMSVRLDPQHVSVTQVISQFHVVPIFVCAYTYKHIPRLANILLKVYIDKDWVAKEYLRCCRIGAWKKENTMVALKCWHVLDTKLQKLPAPFVLTLEGFLQEGTTTTKSNTDSSDDVVVDDCSDIEEIEC